MKRIFTLALLLLLIQQAFSQTPLANDQKLASLCKVWGFLKYYHPKAADCKPNYSNNVKYNPDLEWLDDKMLFNDSLIKWTKR